jgi:hypothetical protein
MAACQTIRAYASLGMLRGPKALADASERYVPQGLAALEIRLRSRARWSGSASIVAKSRCVAPKELACES